MNRRVVGLIIAVAVLVDVGILAAVAWKRLPGFWAQFTPPQPKPPELRHVLDEGADSAKQPLNVVLASMLDQPQYLDRFSNVLRSRLRHKQFQDLDTFAREIRRTKARYTGGAWQLAEFYTALVEPSAGTDAPDGDWEKHFALLEEWGEAFPDSITPRIAHASTMKNFAWKGRTGNYAPQVTEDQWKLLRERMASAKQLLLKAGELEEKCPHWFSTMQFVALGQGWDREEYLELFQDATEFEPGYELYYYHLSNYLLPKWFGEEGEWAMALADATDARGTDEASATFHQAFSDIIFDHYEYDEVETEIRTHWSRIKRGFHARDRLYKVRLVGINDYARMAYIAQDREEARAAFDRLAESVNPSIWENDRAVFDRARAWAYGN